MSIKVKGAVIILFFLFSDLGVYLSNRTDVQINELKSQISQYKTEYETLLNTHDEMESGYRQTLVGIVSNLYTKESYRNVGGVNEELGQDNELLYEAIINATTPFNLLLEDINNYFSNRKSYLDNIPSIWPVKYNEFNRITSPFGTRVSPFTGQVQNHKGIDITGIPGEEIIATANGIVKENWIYHHVYGKMIVIDHQNGYETLYAHMNKTLVREGQYVERGQVIGYMGETGMALGLHVHYEVHMEGDLVNPLDYLSSNDLLVMNK